MIKEEDCDLESEIKVEDVEIQLRDSIHLKKTPKYNGETIEIKEEEEVPKTRKLLNLNCFYCNTIFVHRSNLRTHISNAHPGFPAEYTGGPIKCQMCWEVFDGVETLQKHYDQNHPDRPSAKQFKCGYCSREYNRKNSLKIHIINHLKNPQYKCDSCEATFISSFRLICHEKIHKNAIYSCDICMKMFNHIKTLKNHRRNRHEIVDEVLKCDICFMKYESKNEEGFEEHLLKHPEKNPFLCSICLVTFPTKDKLRSHFQEEEICLKELEKDRSIGRTRKRQRNESSKVHQCSICGKIWNSLSCLKNHMLKHSTKRYTCEICLKSFKHNGNLLRHMKQDVHINSRHRFKCHWCKEVFGKKSQLKEHAISAHNEKLFYCSICSKTFRIECHLKIHMKTHSEERPYECHLCKENEDEQKVSEPRPKLLNFKNKADLDQHFAKWHKEKAAICFTCSICSKTFGIKWKLADHMLVHTDQKTFECDKCPKKFKRLHEMNIHKKRQHEGKAVKKDDKPYKCNVCDKRFKIFNDIFRHSQTHNDSKIKCEKCPKTFVTELKLRQHIKDYHSGEKKCPVCAEVFPAKKPLETHMKIHNNPPEKCFICSKSFKIRATLMRHLTNGHKMSKDDAERIFNVKTSPQESPVQFKDKEGEEVMASDIVKEEYELN